MTSIKEKNDGTVLSLKNDFLFKVVFGSDTEESKTILKALLNLILRREDDPIVDIHYKNPFQYRRFPSDKETVLDIKVTTGSGDLIDIEMQLVWQDDLKERIINYHGGLIRESLSKGEPYGRMKTTITIGIVDAVFLEDEAAFLNEYYFMNRKSQALLSERSYICCIELPKVNREKKPVDALTPLEICLEYLKYADENGSEYVDALIRRGGKELEMAQEMLKKVTEDEILREEAIAREKFQKDMISFRYHMGQKAKAIEEGERRIEEGQRKIEEGERRIEEGQRKIEEGERRIEEGQRKIEQCQIELEQGQKDLEQGQIELEQGQKDLEQGWRELDQGKRELEQRESSIEQKMKELDRQAKEIEQMRKELERKSRGED